MLILGKNYEKNSFTQKTIFQEHHYNLDLDEVFHKTYKRYIPYKKGVYLNNYNNNLLNFIILFHLILLN